MKTNNFFQKNRCERVKQQKDSGTLWVPNSKLEAERGGTETMGYGISSTYMSLITFKAGGTNIFICQKHNTNA